MAAREELVSTHHLLGSELKVFSYPATARKRGVIFAVHGFRGDHHGLARIVAQLPGYTVIVPDLPGFGASTPMSGTHDVPGYTELLAALADELDLPQSTVLLGHSFGSIVAAELATQRDFAALLLLNPISEPALESSQALLAGITSGYYRLCAALPTGIGEGLLRSRMFTDSMSLVMTKSQDPAVRAYVREQHRAYFGGFHSRHTLAEAYRASITSTVLDYAPALDLPTLLVAGAQDELGSPASQERLRDAFGDARLVMLESVGHLIHYEKAEQTAAAITGFLREISARRRAADASSSS
ncbi:alpha/beta fold hydrolase [Glutamicibacter sp. X7]